MSDFETRWPERTFRNKRGRMFELKGHGVAIFMRLIRHNTMLSCADIQLLIGANKRIDANFIYPFSYDTGKTEEELIRDAGDWAIRSVQQHLREQAVEYKNMSDAIAQVTL